MPGLCCVLCNKQGIGSISAPQVALDVIKLEFASGAPAALRFSDQTDFSTFLHLGLLPTQVAIPALGH